MNRKPAAPSRENSRENFDERSLRKASESGSIDSTPSRDTLLSTRGAGGGACTLSDLKKQRAQALQERLSNSLRFKDTDSLNEQVRRHNDDSVERTQNGRGGSSSSAPVESNGQVQARNNNYMRTSGGSHKYKFSDTTVVGEQDSQTGCCTVQWGSVQVQWGSVQLL